MVNVGGTVTRNTEYMLIDSEYCVLNNLDLKITNLRLNNKSIHLQRLKQHYECTIMWIGRPDLL